MIMSLKIIQLTAKFIELSEIKLTVFPWMWINPLGFGIMRIDISIFGEEGILGNLPPAYFSHNILFFLLL